MATTPRAVQDWVPVNLKELGDTVVIDRRTVELMDGADVSFLIQPHTKQILGIMVYKKDKDRLENGGQTDHLCDLREGSADG